MSREGIEPSEISAPRVAGYVLLALLAVAAPIPLDLMDLPIFGSRDVFTLLGASMTIALVTVALVEARRRRQAQPMEFLPLAAFLMVSFGFLGQIVEYSMKTWDFGCYQKAAVAALGGRSLYDATGYLYPPLTAQVMAMVFRVSQRVVPSTDELRWQGVFYLYQCSQYLLVMGAYLLLHRLGRDLKIREPHLSCLLVVLFLANTPLVRTLRFTQVNLWVLDLIVLALVLPRRHAWAKGLCIALGAHIKLYPILILAPWLIMRDFRAIVWSVVWLFGLTGLECCLAGGFDSWRQFAAFLPCFPRGTFLRDNSLHSLVHNIVKVFTGFDSQKGPGYGSFTQAVTLMLTLACLVWFALRFWTRERSYQSQMRTATSDHDLHLLNAHRRCGYFVDTMALMLLVSPLVWEHHYVLAMPFVVWAFATNGMHKPLRVLVAAFLMLVPPTFDVFPLSYHRLAGLLLLLYWCPPEIEISVSGDEAKCAGRSTQILE